MEATAVEAATVEAATLEATAMEAAVPAATKAEADHRTTHISWPIAAIVRAVIGAIGIADRGGAVTNRRAHANKHPS